MKWIVCVLYLINLKKEYVTGKVKVELYKGNVTCIGRSSDYSLYNMAIASMEDDGGAYNQSDATGFIKLHSLPLKMHASRKK